MNCYLYHAILKQKLKTRPFPFQKNEWCLLENFAYFQILFAMRKIPESEIWKPEPESVVSFSVKWITIFPLVLLMS